MNFSDLVGGQQTYLLSKLTIGRPESNFGII